jgi:hypothetical protein
MTKAASTGAGPRRDPEHGRDGRDFASWPRLSVSTEPRPPTGREAASSSVRELSMPAHEPAMPGAGSGEDAATPRVRVLTGLALVAMGGLLMLTSAGYPWAIDLVRGAWPLFILAVGFVTVIVVTDRDDVVGKLSVVAGLVILFAARFGIVHEATLRELGPWAFILAGLAIALSGVEIHGRPVAPDTHRPSADFSWVELIELWASRDRAPVAGVSARRGGIHDAAVIARPARRIRSRGAECSRCRAPGGSRERPDHTRTRQERPHEARRS